MPLGIKCQHLPLSPINQGILYTSGLIPLFFLSNHILYVKLFLRYTLYQEFFLIFSLPIHISDNNICVQVWATKGLSLEETANLRQVELLQFFSS